MIDFTLPADVPASRSAPRPSSARRSSPPSRATAARTASTPRSAPSSSRPRAAAGVFAPQLATELGGHGLDHRGAAVMFEEAGYSLLGPQAMQLRRARRGQHAPALRVATPAQRERYLRPLAAGAIRSCFAMTEPPPGAGSDPSMLRTTAERVPGGWAINGRKWFITGADGAAFAICMARTGDRIERDAGATMFLVDADNPGWRDRAGSWTSSTAASPAGTAEVAFEDCFVADDAVLGEVGLGFRYAQVRLGPARLTHCMRWLGLARRSLDVALDHAGDRDALRRRRSASSAWRSS